LGPPDRQVLDVAASLGARRHSALLRPLPRGQRLVLRLVSIRRPAGLVALLLGKAQEFAVELDALRLVARLRLAHSDQFSVDHLEGLRGALEVVLASRAREGP